MPVEVVDQREGDAASPSENQVEEDLAAVAEAAAAAILSCLGRADDELCVLLVDDARMRELNLEWRGKDSPTDVLSFSQLEGDLSPSPTVMLGDVVVSVDTLGRQAADRNDCGIGLGRAQHRTAGVGLHPGVGHDDHGVLRRDGKRLRVVGEVERGD